MVKQTVKLPAHRWYRRWRRSERLGWRKWIVDCPDAMHFVGSPSFNKTMLAHTCLAFEWFTVLMGIIWKIIPTGRHRGGWVV